MKGEHRMASSRPDRIVKVGKCPICKAVGDPLYRPFCSRRCSNVDLARWLGGSYAIPGGSNDADAAGDDAELSRRPDAQTSVGQQKGPGDEDE